MMAIADIASKRRPGRPGRAGAAGLHADRTVVVMFIIAVLVAIIVSVSSYVTRAANEKRNSCHPGDPDGRHPGLARCKPRQDR